MAERIATIILLVEDLCQENLLRRYLQRLGHHNRSMRVRRITDGRGAGDQYVRESYASEVRAVRQQLARTKACLIAMIDADNGTIEDRRRQLERALQDADLSTRTGQEPILNLVPKRNVETWILCLNGIVVDEESDYRLDPRVDPGTIKQASVVLFDWTRPNAVRPVTCVPSLEACLDEFGRVP